MAKKFAMRSCPFTSCEMRIRSLPTGFFNGDKANVKSRGDRKISRNCFLAILYAANVDVYGGLDRLGCIYATREIARTRACANSHTIKIWIVKIYVSVNDIVSDSSTAIRIFYITFNCQGKKCQIEQE